MPALRCFARRYLGPRELTGAQWADFASRLPPNLQGRPRLGFAYDDPRVTPPGRIGHDCAVVVGDGMNLPEEMVEDGFETLVSPAGLWATVGVGRREIASGYRAVLDGWFQRRPDYALEGDPDLERHGKALGGEDVVSVSLRVRSVKEDGSWDMAVVDSRDAEVSASGRGELSEEPSWRLREPWRLIMRFQLRLAMRPASPVLGLPTSFHAMLAETTTTPHTTASQRTSKTLLYTPSSLLLPRVHRKSMMNISPTSHRGPGVSKVT